MVDPFGRTTSHVASFSSAGRSTGNWETLRHGIVVPVRQWCGHAGLESDAYRQTTCNSDRAPPFCHYAIDWVRAVEHNDGDSASFAGAHAQIERPNKSVVTRPDVLEIDKQNIERFEHFRCRLAMFAVKAVNRYAQTGMLVTLPFDHVILRLAEKSVLRAKEGGEAKQ